MPKGSEFHRAGDREYSWLMDWRCPICRKPTDSQSSPDFPFCSERCRLIDLGNWSNEKYKISERVIDESIPEQTPFDAQREADERKN